METDWAEQLRFDRPLPEETISYYVRHGSMAERALAMHLRAERMETQEMIERLRGLDRLAALLPEIEMVRAWRRREGWLNAPMAGLATDVLGVVLEVLEPWRTEGG